MSTKTLARERPRLTAKFYRAVGTKGWRKSAYSTDTWKYPVLRRWIMARITKKGRRILSIGCGTGELERGLKELRHRVVGLDFSFEMLQTAARRGHKALIQGDAHFLPFPSACFDVVILPESLGHLNADVALQEAKRVLKKHGRLLITTYPEHREVHPLYTRSSLEGLSGQVMEAGFRVKECRLLRPKRNLVEEVAAEKGCELLYVLATRRDFQERRNGRATERDAA